MYTILLDTPHNANLGQHNNLSSLDNSIPPNKKDILQERTIETIKSKH